MENAQTTSLFQDLWNRRFFQYLATYIAVCWGIVQFLLFAVDRYKLDSSIIEKFLLFALICLPAMAMFIYNHGRPGDDDWKPVEKIFIPASLILGIMATTFVNSGNSEAPVERVSVTTTEGDTIVRNVPNLKYTNRVAFFPFENKTSDLDKNWLRHGIPMLTSADVEQDMRVFALNSFTKNNYETYGATLEEDIKFATKLKIARDRYSDEFVTGNFSKEEGLIVLEAKMFSTDAGKEMFSKKYKGENVFSLVDQLSVDLNNTLYSVEIFEESEIVDLPVDNIISSNEEALKRYVEAVLAATDNKVVEALQLATASTELDDQCAQCYAFKGILHNQLQDLDNTQASMNTAMDLSSSLPERERLLIQYYTLNSRLESDKAKRLLHTWMKLYPKDYRPYDFLMQLNQYTRNWDQAKEIGELALANGHHGSFYTRMASLCTSTGEFEKAEKYLKEFEKRYPEKAKENTQFGDILLKQGKLDEAIKYYEDVSILNDKYSVQNKLANVYKLKGDFTKAEDCYNRALAVAKKASDTTSVYFNKMGFYVRQGKIQDMFNMQKLHEEKSMEFMQPFMYSAANFMGFLEYYMEAGKEDEFREEITRRFPLETNPFQNGIFHKLGDFLISGFTKKDTNYWDVYQSIRPVILRSIGPDFDYFAESVQKTIEGKYEESNELLETYVDSTGTARADVVEMIMDNLYQLEEYDEILKETDNTLKLDPSNPKILLYKAKTLEAKNKNKEALKILDKVDVIYKNADTGYHRKLEAEEMRARLTS